jgi:hypothetical protein
MLGRLLTARGLGRLHRGPGPGNAGGRQGSAAEVWPQAAHVSPPLAAQESRSCSQAASSLQYTHMRDVSGQRDADPPRHETFFLAHRAQVLAGASVSEPGVAKMSSITRAMSGFA